MKHLWKHALIVLFALSVTACNTIRGAGQDIEDAGETVQDAAT
ncbi:entericidin A/B family lipoprotein [Maricaulis sp.]|tara:strand:- start:11367 stop:11495 length:129 start_codon:yes stop_codon:yes gene_type:complete